MKVENPLYASRPDGSGKTQERGVVTARIENTQAGVCPKCNVAMATAPLGQSMGNQKVFFCLTCRVAEPIPV
jgi:hypothetical protein